MFRKGVLAVLIVAAAALIAAGCGSSSSSSSPKIALLLPESKTARYESHDRPDFEAKVKELCSKCQIIYSNANQDPAAQQSQAESALTQGAKVLVLDPVDAASAHAIVVKANQQKVPVISYDRLLTGSNIDWYVSFDNVRVGQLQAETLVSKLKSEGKASGTIVMINGSPTDNNAHLFKQGAHSVIDKSGLKVGKEYDTPDWSPDQAQNEMTQAITALGKTGFVGDYNANDGTAGGAIAAMKAQGLNPSTIPSTGQDAELAAIQRILLGEQYMTVYKAVTPEAQDAAIAAVSLAQGKGVPSSSVNQHVNNGVKSVPSQILTPVAVTKSNINSTIVKDKFWTPAQICTSAYAAACKAAGIQ
jgi:D-xylose transport system substrate-binding protein